MYVRDKPNQELSVNLDDSTSNVKAVSDFNKGLLDRGQREMVTINEDMESLITENGCRSFEVLKTEKTPRRTVKSEFKNHI